MTSKKILISFIFGFSTSSFGHTCNNWLATPSQPSSFSIGDLDVSGNQLTIEATVNKTSIKNLADISKLLFGYRILQSL